MEKFIINSVISATNTAKMSPEDQDDIISKIKSSGDGGEDENDAYDEIEDPAEMGVDPSVPAPEAAPAMEGIQILPKEHKQVFKNAKLGVTEGFGEGSYVPKEANADTNAEDWDKIGREVEYGVDTHGLEEDDENVLGGIDDKSPLPRKTDTPLPKKSVDGEIITSGANNSEENLAISDKKDILDDETMKTMIVDFLMKNNSEPDVAPAPTVEPVTTPKKSPKRESPYRITRTNPLPNPNPKANN